MSSLFGSSSDSDSDSDPFEAARLEGEKQRQAKLEAAAAAEKQKRQQQQAEQQAAQPSKVAPPIAPPVPPAPTAPPAAPPVFKSPPERSVPASPPPPPAQQQRADVDGSQAERPRKHKKKKEKKKKNQKDRAGNGHENEDEERGRHEPPPTAALSSPASPRRAVSERNRATVLEGVGGGGGGSLQVRASFNGAEEVMGGSGAGGGDGGHADAVLRRLLLARFATSFEYAVHFPALVYSYQRGQGEGRVSLVEVFMLVAAFSIGQALLAPAVGAAVDRYAFPVVLAACALTSILGNALFMAAAAAGGSLTALVLGRFIAGVGGSHTLVGYSLIARLPAAAKRQTFYKWQARGRHGSAVLGLLLGGLAALGGSGEAVGWAPGVLALLAHVLSVTAQLSHVARMSREGRSFKVPYYQPFVRSTGGGGGSERRGRDSMGLQALLFTVTYCYWSITVAALLYNPLSLQWTAAQQYFLFMFMALIGLLTVVIADAMSNPSKTKSTTLLQLALFLCMAGATLLFENPEQVLQWQLLLAVGLTNAALALAQHVGEPLFHMIVGQSAVQGTRMAVFHAPAEGAGAVGGALTAALVLEHDLAAMSILGSIASLAAILALSTLLLAGTRTPTSTQQAFSFRFEHPNRLH